MAINQTRTARMATKSVAELHLIYKGGSLASAAAAYELKRRGLVLPKHE